jgi:phosphohistidine phosphatase
MKLVLFRHGLAGSSEKYLQTHKDDSKRPLTTKGREVSKSMAKNLKVWEPDFDFIVTSPYARAIQTAEVVAQVLKISNVLQCSELTPASPILSFVQWLRIHTDEAQSVLVVGHEPQLGRFASWCLSGSAESFFELKKSGIIALETTGLSNLRPASAKLLWQVAPRMF